jgi:hypothetical protein
VKPDRRWQEKDNPFYKSLGLHYLGPEFSGPIFLEKVMTARILRQLRVAFFTLTIASLFPVVVAAQWTMSLPPPTQTAAYFANDNLGREVSEEISRNERLNRINNRQSADVQARRNLSSEAFVFSPSLQRRRATLTVIADEYQKTSPGSGNELRQLLLNNKAGDVITQMATPLAEYGLSTNNLADAYVVYWMTAWQAANGVLDQEFTKSQVQAVKKQVVEVFNNIPKIANASDADQQAYAEVLLVQMVIIQNVAESSKSDPAASRKFSTDVKTSAKMLGVDLDYLMLTQTGFAPQNKKRGDASRKIQDDEPALASADTTPAETSWSNGRLAMIAAAGGAGLVGMFLFGRSMATKG